MKSNLKNIQPMKNYSAINAFMVTSDIRKYVLEV